MTGVEWAILGSGLVLLVVGIVISLWITSTRGFSSARAHQILNERYAQGEISTEEFSERRNALGGETRRGAWWPVAAGLIAGGLIVMVVVLAVGPERTSMMDGSMMGSMGSMMDGETGRNAPAPQEGADEELVIAREFSFTPSMLEMAPGETVNITLDNAGAMYHALTISELDFELRANGGVEVSGALTAPKPGRYEYICAVPGHAGQGMTGVLVVR